MRILYEPKEKPRPLETEVGAEIHNQYDGITYTKNKYGEIIVIGCCDTGNGPTGGLVPVHGIIMFSGTHAQIPHGWALCDGKGITPDLSNKFIMGTTVSGTGKNNPAYYELAYIMRIS